ncbi:MAG: linear amide C-N hydrolase [Clostridia bacterium]|nr:linear amide C-N hydrolase [Clostridia bacterium]
MCTSISLPLPDGRRLFGRTLDLDEHFGECVLLAPRGFSFRIGERGRPSHCRDTLPLDVTQSRHAILGVARPEDGYPLFADAMNDGGLCMAGLRFARYAVYPPVKREKPDPTDSAFPAGNEILGMDASHRQRDIELAPWELIPFVLGHCANLAEARRYLARVRLVDIPFSSGGSAAPLPNAPLHWHISGATAEEGALVVEPTAAGLQVYEDVSLGVLTNAPPYPAHLAGLSVLARDVSPCDATGHLRAPAMLPSGYDSPSRFRRGVAVRRAALVELARGYVTAAPIPLLVSLFAAVAPPPGMVPRPGAPSQRTLYTACADPAARTYTVFTERDAVPVVVSLPPLDDREASPLTGESALIFYTEGV